MKRGVESEKRVLADLNEPKNTQAFDTSQGTTIPDINNSTQLGDIKDVKTLSDTKQMKAQREAAAQQGKEHVVYTGDKTKVTKPMVQSGSKIETRTDLGPKYKDKK